MPKETCQQQIIISMLRAYCFSGPGVSDCLAYVFPSAFKSSVKSVAAEREIPRYLLACVLAVVSDATFAL
jgi:hypothetical protein